jgi:hypothetical protein
MTSTFVSAATYPDKEDATLQNTEMQVTYSIEIDIPNPGGDKSRPQFFLQ